MDYKRSEKYHSTKFSPEVWNLKKLKDLALLITDRIDVKQISLEDYVSTENLLPNKGGKEKAIKIPPYGNVTRFEKGDILLSNIRPYFKKIWLATNNGGCSNDVLVIRPKNEISNSYLYYCLQQDVFFDYVTLSSKGTKMPRGDKDAIFNFEFPIPPLNEQIAVSKILSDLGAKIELNQKMNKTLESIAQAIFKHWFIDFEFPNEEGKPYKSSGGEMVNSDLGEIPKGWDVSFFSEFIEVNPSRKLSPGVLAKKVGMSGLTSWQAWIDGWGYETYSSGSKFKNGDTLFARITPSLEHGKTALVHFLEPEEIGFGSTEFIVFGKGKIKSQYYIFNLSRSDVVRRPAITAMSGSSGRQRVPDSLFDRLLILKPPDEIIDEFDKLCGSIYKEIFSDANEIVILSHIRDALLPRLMSRKWRIKDGI